MTYQFLDAVNQGMWKSIRALHAHGRVDIIDRSNDGKVVVIKVQKQMEAPYFALINLRSSQSWSLGKLYEKLEPQDISPVQSIRYKAKDGLTIQAYVTIPSTAGADPRNLPLVVLPHGGPEARDEPGFSWMVQGIASQGYVVLQPNFRGSTGLGHALWAAGLGQWGRKMQTDLSDGVRYLAGQGLIDPEKVCIVGASYGGYAALAGAAIDRGIYRCAVSIAGISDPELMMRQATGAKNNSALATLHKLIAYPVGDVSPIKHVKDIDIPVLLIHGRDDTRVAFEQSEIMEKAMKRAHKNVKLVRLPDEDHFLSQGATRYQTLSSVAAFLAKYNPASLPNTVSVPR